MKQTVLFSLFLLLVVSLAPGQAQTENSWPMAGANPQRTSWTPEEVRGQLRPVWYRPIGAYIPPRNQIIAANGLLYVSTARGLYALDADDGDIAWIYPTELPLGHSPTAYAGRVYVGGLDRKIHAIDALTGQGIWMFEAKADGLGAGFETNPLVLDLSGQTMIFAGNRDGHLYAIRDDGEQPALVWAFRTEGPILFSPAYADGVIYFASNDSHAYAVNAQNGTLVWQSARLPGAGFQSWWPVIYQNSENGADVVVLAGSNNYRFYLEPALGVDLQIKERDDIFPDRLTDPRGTLYGPRNADGSVDATRVLQYFERKPWRRTYFVLDRATGQEITFDFDGDGQPEYAPILWHGTHSGNRYPPVIGADGVIYQSNMYMSDPSIAGGQFTGWLYGTPFISTPSALWKAMDEPLAVSAGGALLYWDHCNDRSAGAFDVTVPNTSFYPDSPDRSREWVYFDGGTTLESLVPNYNIMYEGTNPDNYLINSVYVGPDASQNGIYGQHGDQNPPIPYQGRVYVHRSNAVIAFGDYEGSPTRLPVAPALATEDIHASTSKSLLEQRLTREVEKVLAAGHLRPGYRSTGLFDNKTRDQYGDYLIDYWHYPSDILYALAIALPYLPSSLQDQVLEYLRAEYETYPPHQYTHVGWRDGSAREPYELPAETEADRPNHPAFVSGWGFDGWTWPPHMFYALWKYAEVTGSAREVFDASRNRLETAPPDDYLRQYPYIHNAYIAGYLGYLELESLAGYPESSAVRLELERLLNFRAVSFDKDTPFTGGDSNRTLSVARNFMFLVPELGHYLREHIQDEILQAVKEYDKVTPYWFVSNYGTTFGEGGNQPYYDPAALFQAKAWILGEPREELLWYLDVPAVQVGDLFYIQNLVAAIEAPPLFAKTANLPFGYEGDAITYTLEFYGRGDLMRLSDTLPPGVSQPADLEVEGTDILPQYNPELHVLEWNGTPPDGQRITIRYSTTIVGGEPELLVNTAQLQDSSAGTQSASTTVFANPYRYYLSLVAKSR